MKIDVRRLVLGWLGQVVALGWMVTFSASPLVSIATAAAMPDDCHECCDAMVGVPGMPMSGHDMARCCVMEGAPAPASTPARTTPAAPITAAEPVVTTAWLQPNARASAPPHYPSPPLPIPVLQRTSVLLI